MWPVPLYDLCSFIAYLFQEHFSHSSIKCYLAGISFYSKVNEFEDNTQKFTVKKMLEGINRSRVKGKDPRLPITKELLQLILKFLPFVCFSCYEVKMFQAAFSVAYHGLLRIGELASGGCSNHVISVSDVSFSSFGMKICIPSSKTDQIGTGYKILLQPHPDPNICPAQLTKNFLKDRPPIAGPLFCHFDGRALTRYQFVSVLKKTLSRAGINSTCFTSHSFRIGRATTLSMEGLSDSKIMQFGRWKSNAYKSYIRPIIDIHSFC